VAGTTIKAAQPEDEVSDLKLRVQRLEEGADV
jgi:hypothetical protein